MTALCPSVSYHGSFPLDVPWDSSPPCLLVQTWLLLSPWLILPDLLTLCSKSLLWSILSAESPSW